MKLERSKEWWLAQAAKEEVTIGAGLPSPPPASRSMTVWLCGNAGYEHNQAEWIVTSESVALGWLQDERIRRRADEERQAEFERSRGREPIGDLPSEITGTLGEEWRFEFGVGDFCYVRKREVLDSIPTALRESGRG